MTKSRDLGNLAQNVSVNLPSSLGSAGQVVTVNSGGSALEFANVNAATGGGSDKVFYENGQNVTTNYTITDGKNAMSAGPITIDNGVTVTVGAGETYTVV